uniref:Lysozyme n=1 Tax=Bubo bubo TaxID=30461 RepID=A0A8C0F2W8_BUBBB
MRSLHVTSPLRLLLLALLTAATKAKVFKGLDDYGGYRLCMAFYESTFNTAAQSIKANGSANYSVFQISSQLWCTDDHSPLDNGCRVACRGTTTLLLQSQPKEWVCLTFSPLLPSLSHM